MTDSPGARIKYLRSLSNMSQEELGRRVGVQRAAINKYEKGSVTNIPIATIEKIANVFNVSPTFIVCWNNSESNPLATEVRIIQGIKRFYGADAIELLESYIMLSDDGKTRLLQYSDELTKIYT